VPAFAAEHVIVVKLAGLGALVQVLVDTAAELVEVPETVGTGACTRFAAKLVSVAAVSAAGLADVLMKHFPSVSGSVSFGSVPPPYWYETPVQVELASQSAKLAES